MSWLVMMGLDFNDHDHWDLSFDIHFDDSMQIVIAKVIITLSMERKNIANLFYFSSLKFGSILFL